MKKLVISPDYPSTSVTKACVLCGQHRRTLAGAVPERVFVSLKVPPLPARGSVCVCESCVREAAKDLGWGDIQRAKAAVEAALEAAQVARSERDEAETRLAELESLLSHARRLGVDVVVPERDEVDE